MSTPVHTIRIHKHHERWLVSLSFAFLVAAVVLFFLERWEAALTTFFLHWGTGVIALVPRSRRHAAHHEAQHAALRRRLLRKKKVQHRAQRKS